MAFELRTREPMLPMRFFRSRAFSAGNSAIFFAVAALFCGVFFMAQFMQVGLGSGPLDAGLQLLPWTATLFFVAPVAGMLVDRFGERPFLVTGPLLQFAGMGWIALIAEAGMSYGRLVPPLIVSGVGISMTFPAAQNSVIGSVPEEAIGKASGTNNTMRELGGVFGIAVSVAVFAGLGELRLAGRVHRRVRRRDGGVGGVLAARGRGRRGAAVAGTRREGGMGIVTVRYTVKPGQEERNEELVRDVYAELSELAPADFRYATFRLDGGRTFVHFAVTEGDDPPRCRAGRVQGVPARAADRCEEARWSAARGRGRVPADMTDEFVSVRYMVDDVEAPSPSTPALRLRGATIAPLRRRPGALRCC